MGLIHNKLNTHAPAPQLALPAGVCVLVGFCGSMVIRFASHILSNILTYPQNNHKIPTLFWCFAPALAPLAALPPRAGAIFFALQKIKHKKLTLLM